MNCPSCNVYNTDINNFCHDCGAALRAPQFKPGAVLYGAFFLFDKTYMPAYHFDFAVDHVVGWQNNPMANPLFDSDLPQFVAKFEVIDFTHIKIIEWSELTWSERTWKIGKELEIPVHTLILYSL